MQGHRPDRGDIINGVTPGDEPSTRDPLACEPWRPRGSPEPAGQPGEDVRWHTVWWLLFGSLLFSACAFSVAWSEHTSAMAFARSAHEVTGEVVESDCWVLCKGGPHVRVAYHQPGTGRVVASLDGVDRRYRVGDVIDVIYSDDPDSLGYVVLPPAEQFYRGRALRWAVAGGAGLVLAVLAWAFPANLRRLDRRDAARAARQTSGRTADDGG